MITSTRLGLTPRGAVLGTRKRTKETTAKVRQFEAAEKTLTDRLKITSVARRTPSLSASDRSSRSVGVR